MMVYFKSAIWYDSHERTKFYYWSTGNQIDVFFIPFKQLFILD